MYSVVVNDEYGRPDSYTRHDSIAIARRVARDGAKQLHGYSTVAVELEDGSDSVMETFKYEHGGIGHYDDLGRSLEIQ